MKSFASCLCCILSLTASATEWKIMSYNICHCTNNYRYAVTDANVQNTARVIAAEEPDFACLQEVDKETARSDGIDQAARLAELLTEATGTRYYGTFGKGRDYQGGEFGVAIISKQQPLSMTNVAIPEGSEPRSLLICEFADFYVATVHLDTDTTYRATSLSIVKAALSQLSKPVFITGDWNDTPSSATLAVMGDFVKVISPTSGVVTYGSKIIDYIAVDKATLDDLFVRTYVVPEETKASDHSPIVTVVEFGASTFFQSGWPTANPRSPYATAGGKLDTGAFISFTSADPLLARYRTVRATSGGNLCSEAQSGGLLIIIK